MCEIKVYDEVLADKIINFLQKVMPESGRKLELDTLSTSEKAIRLYQKSGFVFTERYNDNQVADVFMVMDLDNDFMCERNTK